MHEEGAGRPHQRAVISLVVVRQLLDGILYSAPDDLGPLGEVALLTVVQEICIPGIKCSKWT